MSGKIWKYRTYTCAHDVLGAAYRGASCPCCVGQNLLDLNEESSKSTSRGDRAWLTEHMRVWACPTCGWWLAAEEVWARICASDEHSHAIRASGAALARFQGLPSAIEVAALEAEVADHLSRKGTSTQWKVLEDVVTAVLKDMGHMAVATAYSKDGGVDVVLEAVDGGSTYAQIKHTKNKVGVKVLRELVGTTYIKGASAGLLVTSSTFTKGTIKEGGEAAAKGRVIELVDGRQIQSALRLTNRMTPPSIEDVIAVGPPLTSLLWETKVF